MQRLLKRVYPCVVWSPRIPNFSDSFPSLDGSFHSVTHGGRAAVKSLLIKLLFPNPLCTHFHPIYFIRPSLTMKSPYFCKFPFIQTKIQKKKSLSVLRADKVLSSMVMSSLQKVAHTCRSNRIGSPKDVSDILYFCSLRFVVCLFLPFLFITFSFFSPFSLTIPLSSPLCTSVL